ncbi:MAG: hypothetical protein L3K03_07755 [Thermoplasmata archaeon]|nr:hypothetical protein [Thermoplasmata archaeon]
MAGGYDPTVAPSPPTAPSPPAPARHAYLVGRLRSRQITIEEAQELYELQQALILRLSSPPPTRYVAPPPAPAADAPASPVARPTATFTLGDDALWLGLLGLGASAGIFAAILKRSQAGPAADTTGTSR